MRGYEVGERAKRDIQLLYDAHAIACGHFLYIIEHPEEAAKLAQTALDNMAKTFEEAS